MQYLAMVSPKPFKDAIKTMFLKHRTTIYKPYFITGQ
jgi:hypothetical protein